MAALVPGWPLPAFGAAALASPESDEGVMTLSWAAVACAAALIVVQALASLRFDLGLHTQLLLAAVRCVVQLDLLGMVLGEEARGAAPLAACCSEGPTQPHAPHAPALQHAGSARDASRQCPRAPHQLSLRATAHGTPPHTHSPHLHIQQAVACAALLRVHDLGVGARGNRAAVAHLPGAARSGQGAST